MRLHRLEVCAFGPFRERQRVDLDELTAAGLFLLHGATGAGKTSVLDAVCFALYGRVPGARSGVSGLRSHYAEAGEAPEVVLEFSVGPRRFEVQRRPAWERPKRRGEGTTTAQAGVLVRELVDGEWVTRSTRIDESAHLLDDVVGMGPDQFTKLVLLPQGEFAAFLRADADTRRTLLERLFGTDRFTGVQNWLREHRARVRAELGALEEGGRRLVAQAEQAAAAAARHVPAEPTTPEADRRVPVPPVEDVAPLDRVTDLVATLTQAREQALSDQLTALSDLERAEMLHDQGQAMAQLAAEFEALVTRQEALDTGMAVVEQARSRLRRADRARALAPLAPALRRARAAHDAALVAVTDTVTALSGPRTVPDAPNASEAPEQDRSKPDWSEPDWDRLTAERDRIRDALAVLADLAGDADERERLLAELGSLSGRIDQLDAQREKMLATMAAAERRCAEHEAAAAAAREVAVTGRTVGARLADVERRARAVVDRDRLTDLVDALRDRLVDERERAAAGREHYLDLRERRLEHLAAELAATLVEGRPCRVCGATEHPDPAASRPDRVDAAAEELARLAAEQAADTVAQTGARLAGAQAELAAATEQAAGLDAAAAAEELRQTRTALEQARQAEQEQARHEQAAAESGLDRQTVTTELVALAQELERVTAEARTHRARYEVIQERLVAVCGPDGDLSVRRAGLTVRLIAVETAVRSHQEARTAAAHREQVEATALAAARDGGFDDLDEALAAVLDDTTHAALERSVIDYQVEHESVYEQLADERFTALHEGSAAVLDGAGLLALADEVEQVRIQGQEATRRLAICENAAAELGRLHRELVAHLAQVGPAREEFDALDELSRCADGTGGDNSLRMSLSAFVLAARLEQVAAAATARLAQMSSGRYALEHVDSGERGRGRAGLSLAVVDAWTGQRRETASLSGGEAFYTSLALALGLADVVAAEAGGVALDTLFIDEGFGSLDEDTLEEVMDVLDGLRTGGRCVGVVSHLAELRQRIGTRLEVAKSDRGSTLTTIAS